MQSDNIFYIQTYHDSKATSSPLRRTMRLLQITFKNAVGPETKCDDPKKSKEKFPEEPTTCCMSGCANCVWLDYVDKMSEYFKDGGEKAVNDIEEKIQDPSMKAFLLTELRMRNKFKKQ